MNNKYAIVFFYLLVMFVSCPLFAIDNVASDSLKNSLDLNYVNYSRLGQLEEENNVKLEKVFTGRVNSKANILGPRYNGPQGFCCDGSFFYISLVTSKTDKYCQQQETKLIKIDMKNGKIVHEKHVGKIGHCNSLTYNSKNKCIYATTASKKMPFVYKFNNDFTKKEILRLFDENQKEIKDINLYSLDYNEDTDSFIAKLDNYTLAVFDDKFILKKRINCSSHLTIDKNMAVQVVTCDGVNIFSVCSDKTVKPRINYILVFDIDGKYLYKITLPPNRIPEAEFPELEQLARYKNDYYVNSALGYGRYGIYKITLRKIH